MIFGALLTAAVLSATASAQETQITVRDLYTAFQRHGVAFDRAQVRTSAVAAVLTATDPYARILTATETAAWPTPTTLTPERLAHAIGYLKLTGIDPTSGTNAVAHIRTWHTNGINGIILDLRGARGDSFRSVTPLATLFTPPTTSLFSAVNGRGKQVHTYRATTTTIPPCKLPLMVLVNERTAGASEVLAAALKGRPRVVLIGRPTEGDLRSRQLLPLTPTGSLYIATRRAVLSDRTVLTKGRLEPNIHIPTDTTRATPEGTTPDPMTHRVGNDAVLGRAVDLLRALDVLEKKP